MTEPGIDLDADLRHHVGSLDLDVQFALTKPWTALFAPSGAGKTTVLRLIAGLERPDAGRVRLRRSSDEVTLVDTEAGVFVAPHKRKVRLVAQRPALFPHRDVLWNVQYRMDGAEGLEELLGLCRVEHLREKMPSQLSGGERQRVALARALATSECRLLMLDEPFSGLEGSLRQDLIGDLRAWLARRGTPVLLVTHDVAEVFAAGAEVLRMESGRIVAVGTAEEVLAGERERVLRVLG